MCVSGYCGQKTRFKGTSIRVEQYGQCRVRVLNHKEEYILSLPELHMRGLFTGRIFVEITGEVTITSNNNYRTQLKFIPKAWFGGDYHRFKGEIFKPSKNDTQTKIYSIEGSWHEESYYTHLETGQVDLLFHPKKFNLAPKIIRPIEEQEELESRRVWNKVTELLKSSDWNNASIEKSVVEDRQREIRKERVKKNQTWVPKYFYQKIEDEEEEVNWEYNHYLGSSSFP
jgi:hypothetical protein